MILTSLLLDSGWCCNKQLPTMPDTSSGKWNGNIAKKSKLGPQRGNYNVLMVSKCTILHGLVPCSPLRLCKQTTHWLICFPTIEVYYNNISKGVHYARKIKKGNLKFQKALFSSLNSTSYQPQEQEISTCKTNKDSNSKCTYCFIKKFHMLGWARQQITPTYTETHIK